MHKKNAKITSAITESCSARRQNASNDWVLMRERKAGSLLKPNSQLGRKILDFYSKTEGFLLMPKIPPVSSIMLTVKFDYYGSKYSLPELDQKFIKNWLWWRINKQCKKRALNSCLRNQRHLSLRQSLSGKRVTEINNS